MLREIVLDTETTGLDARKGDRLIEIGCIELVNRIPIGARVSSLHQSRTRTVPAEAEAVHGISTSVPARQAACLLKSRATSSTSSPGALVIHNATFDVGFLNAELERIGPRHHHESRHRHAAARAPQASRRPQQPRRNSAKRYGIDNSEAHREHGALMDLCSLRSLPRGFWVSGRRALSIASERAGAARDSAAS